MNMTRADRQHTGADEALCRTLRSIVGAAHVLRDPGKTGRYTTGYRFGHGEVAAVVRPGSLLEQWRVLEACVAADVIVIFQAANTGLTGGSTPQGSYDRDVYVISLLRVVGMHLLGGGRQVVCLPGTTLHMLEKALRPLGRDPHSVIGSSCIGASVIGGVCNNSGGSLMRRGPAYTRMALYARVDAAGRLELVNHLGIALGDRPEAILSALDNGTFRPEDVVHGDDAASDLDYAQHVRRVDEPTAARFNADPRRLFEASGSAGKIMLFAVRLDTFAAERDATTFYIGTNEPDALAQLRRDALERFETLPIAAEYMHRDAFDIAATYGKDVFVAIELLGTARLQLLFSVKSWIDRVAGASGLFRPGASDRLLQRLSTWWPQHLPVRIRDYRGRYAHHLMLKVGADGADEARSYLSSIFPNDDGDFFECSPAEGAKAFLHRFAAAGAAVRYRTIHPDTVEDIVALDIALPRNARDWFEVLPDDIDREILVKLYYGHFFCHVLHQDYIVAKGSDPATLEHRLCATLDARGVEYPAEHNVGHTYRAKDHLASFYRALDPQNRFNPGIGMTSRNRDWA